MQIMWLADRGKKLCERGFPPPLSPSRVSSPYPLSRLFLSYIIFISWPFSDPFICQLGGLGEGVVQFLPRPPLLSATLGWLDLLYKNFSLLTQSSLQVSVLREGRFGISFGS